MHRQRHSVRPDRFPSLKNLIGVGMSSCSRSPDSTSLSGMLRETWSCMESPLPGRVGSGSTWLVKSRI